MEIEETSFKKMEKTRKEEQNNKQNRNINYTVAGTINNLMSTNTMVQ
jgi:hypothetical protein